MPCEKVYEAECRSKDAENLLWISRHMKHVSIPSQSMPAEDDLEAFRDIENTSDESKKKKRVLLKKCVNDAKKMWQSVAKKKF